MIEVGAAEIPEEEMIEALDRGHAVVKRSWRIEGAAAAGRQAEEAVVEDARARLVVPTIEERDQRAAARRDAQQAASTRPTPG